MRETACTRDLLDPAHCEARGFHGPFGRAEVYDAVPGWEGLADCLTCGSMRHVATEERRRRETLERGNGSAGTAA